MNDMERADAARQLLESPVFKAAFADVRDDLIRSIETCGFMDVDTQHELTISLQLLNRLKKKLERWVDDGKMEQKRLDQQNWIERARQRFTG